MLFLPGPGMLLLQPRENISSITIATRIHLLASLGIGS